MMNFCDLAYTVSYNPYYRAGQFYTLFVSIVALFPLFHLVLKKLRATTFHANIKILLILYFSQVTLNTAYIASTFTLHVFTPFFADSKCDLILNPKIYMYSQYIGIFAISSPMVTIIAISMERTVALIFAKDYENFRCLLGPVLGTITITINILIAHAMFLDEKFNSPTISFLLVPPTSSTAMSYVLWVLVAINVVNLLATCLLLNVIKTLSKRRRSSLTMRYQMEELLISTKFTVIISFLHILFCGIYLTSTILTRVLGPIYASEANVMMFRGMYFALPTYSLLIGIIASKTLAYLQKQKISQVHSAITLKFTGIEGAHNHDEAILNIWNARVPLRKNML